MPRDCDEPRPAQHSPATGPHHLAMDGWISCAPFEKLLQIDIVEADDGRAVLKMPFRHEFAQGAGLMHGGALVALADTAVVMAIKSIVPPRTHFATVTMGVDFLRPVREGQVLARAQVTTVRDRIVEGRARILDDQERPVLAFKATFKIARDAQIRQVEWGDAFLQTTSQGG